MAGRRRPRPRPARPSTVGRRWPSTRPAPRDSGPPGRRWRRRRGFCGLGRSTRGRVDAPLPLLGIRQVGDFDLRRFVVDQQRLPGPPQRRPAAPPAPGPRSRRRARPTVFINTLLRAQGVEDAAQRLCLMPLSDAADDAPRGLRTSASAALASSRPRAAADSRSMCASASSFAASDRSRAAAARSRSAASRCAAAAARSSRAARASRVVCAHAAPRANVGAFSGSAAASAFSGAAAASTKS